MRTRHGSEIREPDRYHRCPERPEIAPGETLEDVRDKSAGPFKDKPGLERILGECLLLADGLHFVFARHRFIRITVAMLGKNCPPCPEHAHELIAGHVLDVPYRSYAACMEYGFGFRSDAGKRTYRERREERLHLLGGHHSEAVRLPALGC